MSSFMEVSVREIILCLEDALWYLNEHIDRCMLILSCGGCDDSVLDGPTPYDLDLLGRNEDELPFNWIDWTGQRNTNAALLQLLPRYFQGHEFTIQSRM